MYKEEWIYPYLKCEMLQKINYAIYFFQNDQLLPTQPKLPQDNNCNAMQV